MSKTSRTIQFGVCIQDYEHWTPEHLAACDANIYVDSYDEWVVAQIRAKMEEAGMQFIKENPDLFCGEWMV